MRARAAPVRDREAFDTLEHRVHRWTRQRAVRAVVEIRFAVERGKQSSMIVNKSLGQDRSGT